MHALEVGAAIAGALHHRRHGHGRETRAECLEVEGERCRHQAADLQDMPGGVDLRDVAVAAHVEVARRGEKGGTEPRRRRLRVGGMAGMDDHAEGAAPAASSEYAPAVFAMPHLPVARRRVGEGGGFLDSGRKAGGSALGPPRGLPLGSRSVGALVPRRPT